MIHDIFSNQKIKINNSKKEKIIIDHREKNSLVPAKLIQLGFKIEFKQLEVGDYLVKETIIERKEVSDFVNSMVNKRIINQIKSLKQYKKPLIIVEGNFQELRSNIHQNAIKGFILSILLEHKIPIIFTKHATQTAQYLDLIARKQKKNLNLNQTRKAFSNNQQLEYILQSFPNIGATKSKKLLEKFKTLKNLFNANQKELEPILGKKSKEFLNWVNEKY